MNKNLLKANHIFKYIGLTCLALFLAGCETVTQSTVSTEQLVYESSTEIVLNPNSLGLFEAPPHAPTPQPTKVIEINDNIPYFSTEDITSTNPFHYNDELDDLGRIGVAEALIGIDILPDVDRGSIGHFEPSGWNQRQYPNIGSGGWLYNRSHLIAYQLTGNDSYNNIMTGTRWFNEQMIAFENYIAFYVEEEENHVRLRVTPLFEEDNLLASGAYMEAFSIEDNGEGIMFNIYIPNIQDGITIDYSNGKSIGPEGPILSDEITQFDNNNRGIIKGNINSSGEKIYHKPGDIHYERTIIDPSQGERYFKTEKEAKAAGWRPAKQ